MNYTLENIAGYRKEKEELIRLCQIFKNPEKFIEKGAKLPKGIVFYGPIGTGKTMFAKVLAKSCGLNVNEISFKDAKDANHIMNQVGKAFSKAEKRNSPTMILFDEIDKILPNDSEEYYTDMSKMVLAQLLTLIDGMSNSGKVVFVATCNYYGELPSALVRAGRIDKKIRIDKPDFESRYEIAKMYIGRTSCQFEVGIEEIARITVGMSCAEIETLVNECVFTSDEEGKISGDVINSKILEIKSESLPRVMSEFTERIIACRNTAYMLTAREFNKGRYILNLDKNTLCNNFFDGIMSEVDNDYEDDDYYDEKDENKKEENNYFYSKTDFLNTVIVIWSGFIATEKMTGKIYDGFKDKLDIIDYIFVVMASNGMLGRELIYSDYRNDTLISYSDEKINRLNKEFERLSEECYNKAEELVAKNYNLIKELSAVLIERRSMSEKYVEPIIEELSKE